jgi:hypothetical protein
MPRKKKQPISPVFAPVGKPSDDSSAMLVNNLSVKDARHLLGGEGELEASQIAIRVISIIVVASTCAWAIWAGKATAWHLVLPMVAEYFALLIGIVVAYVIIRHKDMRKEARNAFVLLNLVACGFAVSVYVRATRQGIPWSAMLENDLAHALADAGRRCGGVLGPAVPRGESAAAGPAVCGRGFGVRHAGGHFLFGVLSAAICGFGHQSH